VRYLSGVLNPFKKIIGYRYLKIGLPHPRILIIHNHHFSIIHRYISNRSNKATLKNNNQYQRYCSLSRTAMVTFLTRTQQLARPKPYVKLRVNGMAEKLTFITTKSIACPFMKNKNV
jgi:hypothetical protein